MTIDKSQDGSAADQTPQKSRWRLDLTLLGIGGAFDADVGIANTNGLVEIWKNDTIVERILIDCGHTCGRQMDKLGLTYDDIDTVVVSHAHGDHIDGLEVAGYKNLFLYKHRLKIISPKPIIEQIWQSLAPKMKCLQTAPGVFMEAGLNEYFDHEAAGGVDGGRVVVAEGQVNVDFISVPHVVGMSSFAILFSFGDDKSAATLRWSGDTTFFPEAIYKDLSAERGDLVFHDCTFHPYYPATVHTHFEELQTLPLAARELTCLMHHGKLTEEVERRDSMVLCQPLQKFSWDF